MRQFLAQRPLDLDVEGLTVVRHHKRGKKARARSAPNRFADKVLPRGVVGAAIVNWCSLKNSSGFKRQSCLACLRRVALTIPHHRGRCSIPIGIRSHISATMTACPANEPRLNAGQPEIIGGRRRWIVAGDRINRANTALLHFWQRKSIYRRANRPGSLENGRRGRSALAAGFVALDIGQALCSAKKTARRRSVPPARGSD